MRSNLDTGHLIVMANPLPRWQKHIKGSGMNLHDWRRGWGVLFGQIVGSGSGWPAPGADITRPDADSGYPERQPPLDPKVKPEEVIPLDDKDFGDF